MHSYEIFESIYQTTRGHVTEHRDVELHCREHLKFISALKNNWFFGFCPSSGYLNNTTFRKLHLASVFR
jgi:hypothetical protein